MNKGLLFPNVGHKCLMARDGKKKVKSRASTKYATSSDEDNSSDHEENLFALFANLNMQQKEKLNELISVIHEKDELLDSQEDFLIKENKKHVKVKNAYALEIEKCEKLTSELNTCHDTISNLRNENGKLIAKVEKLNVCDDSLVKLKNDNASLIAKINKLNESLSSLKIENDKLIAKAKDLNVCNDSISYLRDENAMLKSKIDELNVCKPSTSTVEHISICTRCRDINVDVIHDHLALIKQQNDHIAQLNAKINDVNVDAKIDMLNESLASLRIENEKLIAKAKDLNVCNDAITNLRDENAILHAKIVELNDCKPSTSTVDHVSICTRCRDVNVDAIHDHLALIKQQNDHIATLTAKINEHDLENENFKFARSMLYSGRHPGIKDSIGFQ
jgi:DNA repair exonuclease SbcCD ATPase subunit